MGSGLILDDDGKKMSKSSKNGVSPIEVIEKYGADVTRMHLHFLGGYEDNTPWTYDGIKGITSFVDKVWSLQDMIKGDGVSKEHSFELASLNKKAGEDYENLKLNTAISAMMIFVKKIKEDGFITKEELRQFLIFLNPLAPHITSEMYERVFGGNIADESWPEYDEKDLVKAEVELAIQVSSKIITRLNVSTSASNDEILALAKADEKVAAALSGKTIVKEIVVPGRIVNIIAK